MTLIAFVATIVMIVLLTALLLLALAPRNSIELLHPKE